MESEKMRIGSLDTAFRVLLVAEIGNNHEGSFTLAEEMLGRAAESGAHAVKFQTFRANRYFSSETPAVLERYTRYQLTCPQFESLKKTADSLGVVFLSTPFDVESAVFLNGLVPAFKIASGDNTFYPLLETVAGFGKPVIMSCGLAQEDVVARAKARIEAVWETTGRAAELALLHCVTSYPTPAGEANLRTIASLRERFGGLVGYSDHTLGIEAAVLAVALGARIVEKHFTLDKNLSEFRDHALSADPEEFRQLVERVAQADAMLGQEGRPALACEEPCRVAVRRSVAAARDCRAGERLSRADLCWVRPGGGVLPGQEELLEGRVLVRDVREGERLFPDMVD